ncbi:MAG: fatty acid desaturase [Azospirillaceae bacterium]
MTTIAPPADGHMASGGDLAAFRVPLLSQSLSQILTSFGGFFAVCGAMYALAALPYGYGAALLLAPLAAGFLVRIFIIQHDCGHRSFFRSRRANDALGTVCSLLTFTPYLSWRRQHAGHHGVWNNLDRRQRGADIYSSCLTVEEYRALTPRQRRRHRLTHHPLVANVLLPPLIFTVLYRFPFDMPKSWRRERRAVHATTLGIALLAGGLGALLGYGSLLAVQGPVLVLASIAGVWLFSVQHRGAETRWAREADWDPQSAALRSTTFLRLPAPLRWFTGNIGFHHIHHLNARIPNYRLRACHDTMAPEGDVLTVSLREAMGSPRYVLWDEDRGRMTTCNEVERDIDRKPA